MDKSAIEQIQESQTASVVNESLGMERLDFPVVAMPASFELHDLEQFMGLRSRFRGEFRTRSLRSFLEYCQVNDSDGVMCFVDPEKMTAETIFNLGSKDAPGHCDDKAILTMKPTSEFQALRTLHGQRVDQKTLAEFVEDWAENFLAQDAAGNDMRVSKFAMAVRNMTIEGASKRESEVGDYKASRSALETVEAKSRHELPATVQFRCVPYEGLDESVFALRISVTAGDDIRFMVRVKRLEQHVEKLGEELAHIIEAGTDDCKLSVNLGTFQG